MEDKPLKVLKRPTPDVESTQGKSVSSVIADVGTAEGKPVKSKKEIPPDVDLSVYEQHRVFPYTKYTKKELKALKIPPRKSGYLMVCEACASGMSDVKATDTHISGKNHKLRLKELQLDQNLSQLPVLTTFDLDVLTHFVETTYQSVSAAVLGQLTVRRGIGEELQELVRQEYPDVSVQLHGSSASEFAVVTSNVNLNLDIPASLESQDVIPGVMKKVVEILNSNAALYTDVTPDYYSFNKIPRILFKHKQSGLLCEIRAMAGNPMMLAPLLQCYRQADERVLKLGVVFLHWAKVCRLDMQEYGYYPGHMFVVMVIHFLQQTTPPVLPVLHELPDLTTATDKEEGDGSIFTAEALSLFTEAAQRWHSGNTQSLGQLWIQLLKYYTVEFPMPNMAVTIRQALPLMRETRQWGTHRLAVEDPMIPKSNLARCGFYDKIFDYYVTCLKQTTVYFYTHLRDRGQRSPSKSPPPVTHSPGIGQEDSSIVFASPLPKVTPTDTPLPSFLGESTLTSVESKSAESAETSHPATPTKLKSHGEAEDVDTGSSVEKKCLKAEGADGNSDVKASGESDVRGGSKDEVDDLATALSGLNISFGGFPAEATPLVTDAVTMEMRSRHRSRSSSPSKSKPASLKLSPANCVLMPYPKMCVACKQSPKHTYKDCPNEALPSLSSLQVPQSGDTGLTRLGELFTKHMKEVAPTSRERKLRKQACDFILKDVRRVYPDAHLKLFGSSANGFGSFSSDLDICLILPGLKPSEDQTEKQCHCEVIERIAKELRKFSDYEQVVSITTARVPIVKFCLPAWQVECDISMENRLAMRNTDMLKAYSLIDERVKILGYAIKAFAKVCDMGDASSGSLSSYAYILLMLHYLQQITPPVVPVLQQLHSGVKTEGPVINNWNCYYFEFDSIPKLRKVWSGLKKNEQGVGELWLGFLRYVLQFDWNEQVVIMRQLEPLTKFDKWWISKPLCIEDPFNLDHNLAANVSGKMRTYILERFQTGLMYHSIDFAWESMDHVMSDKALVGDCKAPKFLICHYCNTRGHRQAECPVRAEDRRSQSRHRRRRAQPPVTTDTTPPARAHTYPQQGIPSTALPMSIQAHPLSSPPTQKHPLLPPPPHPTHAPHPHQAHYQHVGGQLPSPTSLANQPIGLQSGQVRPPYQHMHSYPPPHGWYPTPAAQVSVPQSTVPPSPAHPPVTPPTHYVGTPIQLPSSQGYPHVNMYYPSPKK